MQPCGISPLAIEAGVQLRDSLTVMQKKAYWVLPNSKKDVPYAPVEQIKFHGKIRARSTWKAAHHLPSVVEQSSSITCNIKHIPRPYFFT